MALIDFSKKWLGFVNYIHGTSNPKTETIVVLLLKTPTAKNKKLFNSGCVSTEGFHNIRGTYFLIRFRHKLPIRWI